NLVFGRDIQKIFGQVPQVCITMPILVGTDGKNKMSKSLGNYIGINEPPYIMFEKLMRMVDDNIIPYLTLLTDKPNNEIQKIENIIKDNPSTESIIKYKKELAFTIVENFHGLEEAKKALESYGNQTKIGVFKLEIPIGELDENDNISLIRLIMLSGKASSKSEARRLVQQGAVYINNIRIDNTEQLIKADKQITLRIGKSFLAEIQWGNKNE
ncbi:MAG: tyrosine--tRNA ligase, partial [Brevinematales bacterium]|nr:tyrosine--tRNA ligase [Brevinematales bacterium]